MSYTQQLFDSLRRAETPSYGYAAFNGGHYQPHAATPMPMQPFGASAAAARHVTFASDPLPDNSHDDNNISTMGPYSSSFAPALRSRPPPTPHPSAGMPSSSMPQRAQQYQFETSNAADDISDNYALAQSQKAVISQLTSRVNTLEDQLAQYRDKMLEIQLKEEQGNAAASSASAEAAQLRQEVAALQGRLAESTSECGRLRDEKAGLSRALLEMSRKVDDAKASAERDKAELAFKLGKESAMAAVAAVQAQVQAVARQAAAAQVSEASAAQDAVSSPPPAKPSAAGARIQQLQRGKSANGRQQKQQRTIVSPSQPAQQYLNDAASAYSAAVSDHQVAGHGQIGDEEEDDDRTAAGPVEADFVGAPHSQESVPSDALMDAKEQHQHHHLVAEGGSTAASAGIDYTGVDVGDAFSTSTGDAEALFGAASGTALPSIAEQPMSPSSTVMSPREAASPLASRANVWQMQQQQQGSTSNTNAGGQVDPLTGLNVATLSTSALLARHEQLRQQEMILLALKQQQAQTKMVALAQQRQQQHMMTLQQSAHPGAGLPFNMNLGLAAANNSNSTNTLFQQLQQQQQQGGGLGMTSGGFGSTLSGAAAAGLGLGGVGAGGSSGAVGAGMGPGMAGMPPLSGLAAMGRYGQAAAARFAQQQQQQQQQMQQQMLMQQQQAAMQAFAIGGIMHNNNSNNAAATMLGIGNTNNNNINGVGINGNNNHLLHAGGGMGSAGSGHNLLHMAGGSGSAGLGNGHQQQQHGGAGQYLGGSQPGHMQQAGQQGQFGQQPSQQQQALANQQQQQQQQMLMHQSGHLQPQQQQQQQQQQQLGLPTATAAAAPQSPVASHQQYHQQQQGQQPQAGAQLSSTLQAAAAPGSPLAGVKASQASSLSENLSIAKDGAVHVSGASGLPPGYPPGSVHQVALNSPPPGGWTVYQHPPAGVKWPDAIPFYAPLVDPGIPILKHGRYGRPHRRLLWLDVSSPSDPILVWHEGDSRQPGRVKEKDRLRLIDIVDIRAGRVGAVLMRSGTEEEAGKYISFSGETRTLDMELPSVEARDFVFKKFADMFQAYATAQIEKLNGDAVTLRVAAIVDGGANNKPGSTAAPPPPPPPPPAQQQQAMHGRQGGGGLPMQMGGPPGMMGGMMPPGAMMQQYGSPPRPGQQQQPLGMGGGAGMMAMMPQQQLQMGGGARPMDLYRS